MIDLVEWQKNGKPFIGTPQQLVDELTYASYANNRTAHPEHPPRYWESVFPQWQQFEQRLQHERIDS